MPFDAARSWKNKCKSTTVRPEGSTVYYKSVSSDCSQLASKSRNFSAVSKYICGIINGQVIGVQVGKEWLCAKE